MIRSQAGGFHGGLFTGPADENGSILPKEGQSANTFLVDKRTGKVVLNGKRLQ